MQDVHVSASNQQPSFDKFNLTVPRQHLIFVDVRCMCIEARKLVLFRARSGQQ